MLLAGLLERSAALPSNAVGAVSDASGDIGITATKGLAVTLFNDGSCTGGKFESYYVEGVCYSTQGNRGMHVQNKNHNSCARKLHSHLKAFILRPSMDCADPTALTVTVYSGGGCSGGSANLDQRKCWGIDGRASFKIFC